LSVAALEVAGLNVRLGGRDVLRDVSFSLAPGAFCGLIGANGSGKTTLLRSILGFETPTAGTIRHVGGLAYVPQKIQLDADMPIRARDLVALGFADQRVGKLSGGQQQRVLIAHALISQPKLLLLDEPLANLDLRAGAEIVALLQRVAAQGVAVLISAHDMNPLLQAMDKLVYLANGRGLSGTVAEVVRTEMLSALYGYHIDVIRVHDRIVVVASGHGTHDHKHMHDHEHVAAIP